MANHPSAMRLVSRANSALPASSPAALIPFISGQSDLHGFQLLLYSKELFTVINISSDGILCELQLQFVCDEQKRWWVFIPPNTVDLMDITTKQLEESNYAKMLSPKHLLYFVEANRPNHYANGYIKFIANIQEALLSPPVATPIASEIKLQKLWSLFTELEDELCCSICSEHFRSPLAFACGHTFCEVCINNWRCKSKPSTSKQNYYPPCPLCQQKFKSMAPNRIVASIGDIGARITVERANLQLSDTLANNNNQNCDSSQGSASIVFHLTLPSQSLKAKFQNHLPTCTPTSVIVQSNNIKSEAQSHYSNQHNKQPEVIILDDDEDEGIEEYAGADLMPNPPLYDEYQQHPIANNQQQEVIFHANPQQADDDDDEVIWL